MSKLELTISTNYIRDWSIENALRELIQNTADANDIGYPMKVTYNPDRKEPTLTLSNEGITIDRDTLLLGTTTKSDDSRQRGCFGEGMKLAWLTLLRAGLKIWIKSGAEKWVPTLAYSDTYKSELLTVETSSATYENMVKVEVRGLGPDIWEQFRQKILFSPGVELNKSDYLHSNKDRILAREDLRGQLFVRGLWVSNMPGDYWFGYDIHDLKLDRDRKLADPWELKSAIRVALNNVNLPKEELWSILNSDRWEETRIIADSYSFWMLHELAEKITDKFHDDYGLDCIPVESTSQSIEAAQHGLKGRVVSKAIKALIESVQGKYEDKKVSRAIEYNHVYAIDELNEEEQASLFWAAGLTEKVTKLLSLSIVDFYGEHIWGAYRNKEVLIARKTLKDKPQLIATFVHEIAHHNSQADDGTIEHMREVERLFGEIVVQCH